MAPSTSGPRRERGVNVQIRADRGGGGSPGLHRSEAEGRLGIPPRSPSERAARAGDGPALAQRGAAPPSIRAHRARPIYSTGSGEGSGSRAPHDPRCGSCVLIARASSDLGPGCGLGHIGINSCSIADPRFVDFQVGDDLASTGRGLRRVWRRSFYPTEKSALSKG